MLGFEKFVKETAVGRAFMKSHTDKEFAARQELVDRLAQRRKDRVAAQTAQDRLVAPLEAAVVKARTQLADAQAALTEGARARQRVIGPINLDISDVERQLVRGVDPRIAEARAAMFARRERDRHTLRKSEEVKIRDLGTLSGSRIVQVANNERATEALAGIIMHAANAFDALGLQNPPDIDDAIAQILKPVSDAWRACDVLEPVA